MKTQAQLKAMIHGDPEYQDMSVDDIVSEVCEYYADRYSADKSHGKFGDVLKASVDFFPKSWSKYGIFDLVYDWCEKAVHKDMRGVKSSTGLVKTLDWYVIR